MNKNDVLRIAGECGMCLIEDCSNGYCVEWYTATKSALGRFAAAMYAAGAENMGERIQPYQTVPAGYVVLSRTPTSGQWDAAWSAFGATEFEDLHPKLSIDHVQRLYWAFHSAMLSAAPRPTRKKKRNDRS